MVKKEKLLQKARNNPKGWRFEELKRLYKKFGFEVRSRKGSHFVAKHPATNLRPTFINHSGELPSIYVKDAVKAIEEVMRTQAEDMNDE